MKFAFALLFFSGVASAFDVPSLTPDNYDELTDGKTVFIKFFAPWCGHCKKMAPDWKKLAEEWKDHAVGYVAEVDCTADGKPLCESNGVGGFPTLKWGDPSSLEDYQGGRSYDALNDFAKENLKPVCSVKNIDLCDDDKKKDIERFLAMADDEIDKMIEEEEKKLEAAEEEFMEAVQGLQAQYQKLSEEKDAKVAAVKAAGLGLLKSVKASKAKKDVKSEL